MEIVKVEQEQRALLKPVSPIPYFDDGWNPHRHYLAAVEDGKILGLVCFNWNSQWLDNAFGMGYTAVAADCRNQGVASALIDAFFALAAEHQRGIYVTQYEPDGKQYLRKLVLRAAEKYQVRVLEKDYLTCT